MARANDKMDGDARSELKGPSLARLYHITEVTSVSAARCNHSVVLESLRWVITAFQEKRACVHPAH